MALDIHILENGRHLERVFSINDAEFGELEKAFNLLAQRTGIIIDEYSDTKFSSGLNVLIQMISQTNAESDIHKRLLTCLKELESEGKSIIFVGD